MVVLVGAPVALLVASVLGPASYTASTSLLVEPIASDPSASTGGAGSVSVVTERQLIRSTLIAQRAVDLLNRDDDPKDVVEHTTTSAAGGADNRITVGGSGDRTVLEIEFEAADPVLAARYAEALADAYLDYRREAAEEAVAAAVAAVDAQIEVFNARLEGLVPEEGADTTSPRISLMRDVVARQLNELESRRANLLFRRTDPGRVITPAIVPDEAAGVPAAVNVVGALALVLLAAAAAAFLVDRRDRRVRGREELSALAGPILAAVPDPADTRPGAHALRVGARGGAGDGYGARGPASVAYGALAVQLASTGRRPLQRVLVAAPSGPGATTVAVELATAVARGGQRALLVACDAESRVLDRLGIADPARFDELLARHGGPAAEAHDWVDEVIVPVPDVDGLWVAAAGPAVTRSDVFPEFTSMLDTFSASFDLVVASGPALLEVANSVRLASIVDGVVLVFDPEVTDRRTLEDSVELLERTSAEVLGTVVLSTTADWR